MSTHARTAEVVRGRAGASLPPGLHFPAGAARVLTMKRSWSLSKVMLPWMEAARAKTGEM